MVIFFTATETDVVATEHLTEAVAEMGTALLQTAAQVFGKASEGLWRGRGWVSDSLSLSGAPPDPHSILAVSVCILVHVHV